MMRMGVEKSITSSLTPANTDRSHLKFTMLLGSIVPCSASL